MSDPKSSSGLSDKKIAALMIGTILIAVLGIKVFDDRRIAAERAETLEMRRPAYRRCVELAALQLGFDNANAAIRAGSTLFDTSYTKCYQEWQR